jgi:hypothetical protein
LRLGVFARVNFFERSLRNTIFFFSSAAAKEFFYISRKGAETQRGIQYPLRLPYFARFFSLRLGVFARVNFFERSLRNTIFFFSSAAAKEFFYISRKGAEPQRGIQYPLRLPYFARFFSLRLGVFARVIFFCKEEWKEGIKTSTQQSNRKYGHRRA